MYDRSLELAGELDEFVVGFDTARTCKDCDLFRPRENFGEQVDFTFGGRYLRSRLGKPQPRRLLNGISQGDIAWQGDNRNTPL
jgi:hypothetical protein